MTLGLLLLSSILIVLPQILNLGCIDENIEQEPIVDLDSTYTHTHTHIYNIHILEALGLTLLKRMRQKYCRSEKIN